MKMTAAVLTVSDSASRGQRIDVSGDVCKALLEQGGLSVQDQSIVPDERESITQALQHYADVQHFDVVVTTGGTGVAPRDVTPEATLDVVHKTLPGVAEAMRAESLRKTPFAMLSRQVAGVRGQTLIINLPGSPKAVEECLTVVLPMIPHIVRLLQNKTSHSEAVE